MPTVPRFERLQPWLDWQQQLHPSTIDLGLERVARVLGRTGWRRPEVPVIAVGGTNGKGSVVALLDAMLRAGGRRVATFTSPHLVDYRERIRIDAEMVSEASLIAAFERITEVLEPDSLTFFEFNTLAALLVFETACPDVLVLEIGLGGRLDAVNVVDPDVAIVASVGLDHMEYLGSDLDSIGREKAGIFRRDRPAVYGSPAPPATVREVARQVGARLQVRGEDYAAIAREADQDCTMDGAVRHRGRWDFIVNGAVRERDLPRPALPGGIQLANAATALMAISHLAPRITLDRSAIERALTTVTLPGRFQRIDDARGFHWILDIAHNPAAAATLAQNLRDAPVPGRTLGVCGMLGDKDVAGVVGSLRDVVQEWFATDAEGPRAISAGELCRRAASAAVVMTPAGTIEHALATAAARARPGDRIVVFGSFHVVGPALVALGVPL